MGGFFKAATLFFSAIFSVFAPAPPSKDVKNLEGKPLPPFQMTSVNGKTINNKTIKGHPVIIDFWATWCGPCKKASPVMQEIFAEYGKAGLIVIGADGLEDKEGPEAALAYAKEHKYSYLFTHTNDKLMNDWGITGVPTMIFVDKTGKVAKVYVGYGDSLKPTFKKLAADLVK